ncbi:hypothetical protein [Actinosynnema sp. NPDC020468]|uniref:hypothetical protein n=1 Tax=Actinosynnema sp. NPDC020468 TaxID=3154488 RepID=UPI0033F8E2F8
MSQEMNTALESLDRAMRFLRQATVGIPYRREGFRGGHNAFVRSVAVLRTSLSYSRSQLAPARRRRGGPRT